MNSSFFSSYYENVISKVDWMNALLIFVLGIGTVFVVLAVLWGILAAMKVVFSKSGSATESAAVTQKESAPVTQPKASAPVKAEKKMSTPKSVATAPPTSEDELVAIFTAAISAAADSTTLRVKSYKKL